MTNKSILDFEVRKQFMDAIRNGRYVVTISVHNPAKKRNDHYAVFKNYPPADILPSLEETNRLIFKQLPDHLNPLTDEPENNTTPDAKSR